MVNLRIDDMQNLSTGIAAWCKPVVIPTYPAGAPDPNPMFLEKRVYQGSSGRVYPLPFIDTVSKTKTSRSYQALHLENEYVYLMLLPEIGGRIHIGYDKTACYDFFYRQNVIKPALVGLAGPWISGGVEFNWPQHHRPSTFMPCEWTLDEGQDGSRTFWMSEHEPMNRMKGMHGIRLVPGSTLIELRARLYNRTPLTQTFLWWANVAARVHELYQSFFPADVRFVADHAKRAGSAFPACEDSYYGVAYGERAKSGVKPEEQPGQFRPAEDLAPNRLDWYSNIPVPTSYMVVSTGYDFFGGYDHSVDAGFVHVADRRVAPGKKQWTWGNHKFGYAWDENLTDEGGPYIELMAGVYTDNQPDFSFIAPYETKTFCQYWYPIRKIGPATNATKAAAISLQGNRVGICPSAQYADALISISFADRVETYTKTICPESPWVQAFPQPPLAVRVESSTAELLVEFDSREVTERPAPVLAQEPDIPENITTVNELYAIGIHLEQYRHATRAPEAYWLEALRRDPEDARCLVALGKSELRRGRLSDARKFLQIAVDVLTRLNPNPADGEAHYTLGVVLDKLGAFLEALDAFGKASWNYAWKGASLIMSARIYVRLGQFSSALDCLSQAQIVAADANVVRNLRATIHRLEGRSSLAQEAVDHVLSYDPLDHWALYEAFRLVPTPARGQRFEESTRGEVQNLIDLALEYQSCGLESEAHDVLNLCAARHPMVAVLRGGRASDAPVLTGVFPSRLEEMLALERAIHRDPTDFIARTLLGNLYYHHRRYSEATQQWEESLRIAPTQAGAWRNLGIAYFNHLQDAQRALGAYDQAQQTDPTDARILYEHDQLLKRLRVAPEERITALGANMDLVETRDDLVIEFASLSCLVGNFDRALSLMAGRQFAPWEGGEGAAIAAFGRACSLKARSLMNSGRHREAVACLEWSLVPPSNLGEARHLLANCSDLWLELGDALVAAGDPARATGFYVRAAEFKGDFQTMSLRSYSAMTYFSAMAMRRLGRESAANALLQALGAYGLELAGKPAKIDYFATSLPSMLLFDEDLQAQQTISANLLQAQAAAGLGDSVRASALIEEVLKQDPYSTFALDLRSHLTETDR